KVSNLVMTYKYFYRGVEQWKDGRLVKFESNTDDNGKRFVVTAAAEKDGLRVRVNNVERMAKAESWLSSYWCLPDPKLRNGPIPVIDADTGKDVSGRLQFVATEQRPVCGRVINVNHYRLTGKTTIDLWYDGSDRLVRQVWGEQGHRTALELAGVRQWGPPRLGGLRGSTLAPRRGRTSKDGARTHPTPQPWLKRSCQRRAVPSTLHPLPAWRRHATPAREGHYAGTVVHPHHPHRAARGRHRRKAR